MLKLFQWTGGSPDSRPVLLLDNHRGRCLVQLDPRTEQDSSDHKDYWNRHEGNENEPHYFNKRRGVALRETFDQIVQIVFIVAFCIWLTPIEPLHWIAEIAIKRLHRALFDGRIVAGICHRREANMFECIRFISPNTFNHFLQTNHFIQEIFVECWPEADRFGCCLMRELELNVFTCIKTIRMRYSIDLHMYGLSVE